MFAWGTRGSRRGCRARRADLTLKKLSPWFWKAIFSFICKSFNKREAFSNKSIYILKSALKYSNIYDQVFLTRVTSPPSFNFLDKIHIAICLTLLSRTDCQEFFKKVFAWRHSVIIVMEPKNLCETTFVLCQTMTIALFFEKTRKNDGNALETRSLVAYRTYNC